MFLCLSLIVYRTDNPFFSSTSGSHRPHLRTDHESCDPRNEDQHRHNIREQVEGPYRDDPLLEYDDHAVRSHGNG